MPIKLTCKCGKTLTVPEDAAGRRARCPACNAVTWVPGPPSGTPPTEPEPMRSTDAVDNVVDAFVSDLERSRERSPQMTQIALTLLIWSGVSFLLTFLASLGGSYDDSVAYWFLVHVPIAATGALLAVGTIKVWSWTPKAMSIASPLVLGASYPLFWKSAMYVGEWRALFFLLVNVVNLGGYAFLNWYFRGHGVAAHFAPTESGEVVAPPER